MAGTTQPTLNISAEWERLDEGDPEERACFAALGIECDGRWLTEVLDGFVNRIRQAPLLSAYHLAEWLAWNWWRLRWEPRSNASEWPFAHRLTTIGHGYVWPNITIYSDGERTALIAKPTQPRPATVFRYIGDFGAIVPSGVFEDAVDRFLGQVLGKLQVERIADKNLHRVYADLIEERQDRDTARRRKLEALLGKDPDEADPAMIERLVADAGLLGEQAVEELAADSAGGGPLLTADTIRQIAEGGGFAASPRQAVRLSRGTRLSSRHEVPAWLLGAQAARALREQQNLGRHPIGDAVLTELAGVDERALASGAAAGKISFALDRNQIDGRVVLHSGWLTGRRFQLARLLADRLVAPPPGRLHAATRAYTYRQKMQRSFAAEFLSPFEAVDEMLAGDYSAEAQQDAAEHFQVSDRIILTLLVNHRRLEREELDDDLAAA
jgi:hypothetical protein